MAHYGCGGVAEGQAPSEVRPALTGVAEGQAPSEVRPALTGVASRLLPLVVLCAVGCIQISEHLLINPDGSGKLTIEARCSADPELIAMMRRSGGRSPAGMSYPPATKEDAARLFPGAGFTVNVERDSKEKTQVVTTTVEFKDINKLLESPYAEVCSLSLEVSGGKLHFAAKMAGRGIMDLCGIKGQMAAGLPPGILALQKKKDELKIEYSVTLPGRASSASGAVDGNTVSWVVDRGKCDGDSEASKKLRVLLEASCRSASIKFTPETPARLDQSSFAELKAGQFGKKAKKIDTEKVAAAARFVPYRLKTVRYFDLTGEGHGGYNQGASLTGAVILPREMAPQRWGSVTIEEAVDDLGNDLRNKDGDRFGGMSRMSGGFQEAKVEADLRHVVSMSFKCPDIEATLIKRLRGFIELTYFGDNHLVKVKDAVAKDDLVTATASAFSSGMERKKIESPEFEKLEIEMTCQQAMKMDGVTMLMFNVEAKKCAVTGLQVFDSAGKPWQTHYGQQGMGGSSRMIQALVPGNPEAPLSIAIVVSGGGGSARIPVSLKDVALSGSEARDE